MSNATTSARVDRNAKTLPPPAELPMCVAWTSDDGERGDEQWCAIEGKLDPDACNDATLCGRNVVMRGGSERREPTCSECREKLGLIEPPATNTVLDAICQVTRERDALRAQVERWATELADALGCVNEHNGARQQPPFCEMVEKVRRMREERDELSVRLAPNRVCTGNRQRIVEEVERRWGMCHMSNNTTFWPMTTIEPVVEFILDAAREMGP